ncbi:NADH dehydrogenase (quinone) subunit D [Truepera radiovictrix]|uniref:NADH-quinone oxidoreductase subunit D n=1 Tax=Truepera radiovictrix (strain DSM 17093 / CIP 108686 / LMG 22925 / RQ-24) TaxID=649638 RepID=D7CWC9_TRURR|nr:NADH dehydrogenase (quinone) subunit D [Truepera radiovictrix]ADI16079.1 NADH dehydrogenase I, D subunit [Truepera radiovictrix DSM 17093]WMT58294.1 NADH dehydrogenase (quinone) subunit D [Truepera radiovictrix]
MIGQAGYAPEATAEDAPKGTLETKYMRINVGPQHPSTHGVLRLVVDLDGERIARITPQIGYLHTGFEKTMENRTYQQGVTYSNRMDYLHGFGHDLAYVLSAEKLVGAQVPERAQRIRVILTELNRIASHLVFLGTGILDMGALTLLFYTFREREAIMDLFEMVCGVRMNYGYFRVGGLSRDLPDEFVPATRAFIKRFPRMLDQYAAMFAKNDIFVNRTKGVGVISKETALDYGLTGPSLRASGVPLDFRKAQPYSGYEDYDFEVPTSTAGDAYNRFMVRFYEMRESLRIVEQALDKLEPGPIRDPDRRISLPPREELETSMEAVIFHFKLVTEGFHPPRGEVYVPTESARGELGYYLVSDGGSMPYRVKVRVPSLINLQSLEPACVGGLFADMVVNIATFDPVLGDVDK